MGLFNKYKGLHEYKILEVVNEKRTPIGTNDKCEVLFEDENVQYFIFIKEHFQNKSDYLLRREKNNKGKIIYLGNIIEPYCFCKGKVFWAFPFAVSRDNHCMTMIDCITGESQKVDFLGTDKVLEIDADNCWDKIIKLSSVDNVISLLVRRNKSTDSNLAAIPLNEDLVYEIKVLYENNRFNPIPVTLDSIVKKGPWPKPKIKLPPGPYTAAEMQMYYDQFGKEAVDEALLLKEIYG